MLRAYREFSPSAPDELYCAFSFTNPTSGPVFALRVVDAESADAASSVLRTLRSFATTEADTVARVSYHQALLSESPPEKLLVAPFMTRAAFMSYHPDEVIDAVGAAGAEPPTGALLSLNHQDGAVSRVPQRESAFPIRRPGFHCWLTALWFRPSQQPAVVDWVRRLWDTVEPHAQGAYVNILPEGQGDLVRATYRTQCARLMSLKRKYDPDNLFSSNPLSTA